MAAATGMRISDFNLLDPPLATNQILLHAAYFGNNLLRSEIKFECPFSQKLYNFQNLLLFASASFPLCFL